MLATIFLCTINRSLHPKIDHYVSFIGHYPESRSKPDPIHHTGSRYKISRKACVFHFTPDLL